MNVPFFSLQLPLWSERADEARVKLGLVGCNVLVTNPDIGHLHVLWRLNRDKRVQVWCRLGKYPQLTELELGGKRRCECPVDIEELFMLLQEGAGTLARLHKLSLWRCSNQVDDRFLIALATAGCGEKLTSLSLRCEFIALFRRSSSKLCERGSGSGSVGCVCVTGALSLLLFLSLLSSQTRRSEGGFDGRWSG